MSERFDVAIAGGGPAGAAAALTLRSHAPQLGVVLLEAGNFRRPKAGEVLPAQAGPVLEQLGVRAAFDAAAFAPALATAAMWAQPERIERHSLFSAAGAGWHLDRARFDRLLIDEAAVRGCDVRTGRSVRAAEALPAGWRLTTACAATIDAQHLIWATGRSWRLARFLDARVRVHEERTAYIRTFETSAGDGTTVVEACPEGWWYTADLPAGRRVVACITDARTAREHGLGTPDGWRAAMNATKCLASSLGDDAVEIGAIVRPAGTVTLDPVCGPGWFAAGDTAFAADPLSSRGLLSAMRSGMFAAYATADSAAGRAAMSRARFAHHAAADFGAYRASHVHHYAQVGRFAETAFWQAPLSSAPRDAGRQLKASALVTPTGLEPVFSP